MNLKNKKMHNRSTTVNGFDMETMENMVKAI